MATRTPARRASARISSALPSLEDILSGVEDMTRARYRTLKGRLDEGNALNTTPSRRRGQTSITRRTPNKTAHLLSLPLEIITEICRQLHPWGLLCLSRTCRALRTMTCSQSSRFLWVEVVEAFHATQSNPQPSAAPQSQFPIPVGLPIMPKELNYLQYIDLLFGTRCMACDSAIGCETFWTLRVRLCRRCQPLNLADTTELMEFVQKRSRLGDMKALELLSCVPSSDPYYRAPSQIVYYWGDLSGSRYRDEAIFTLTKLLDARDALKRKKDVDAFFVRASNAALPRIMAGRRLAMRYDRASVKVIPRKGGTWPAVRPWLVQR